MRILYLVHCSKCSNRFWPHGGSTTSCCGEHISKLANVGYILRLKSCFCIFFYLWFGLHQLLTEGNICLFCCSLASQYLSSICRGTIQLINCFVSDGNSCLLQLKIRLMGAVRLDPSKVADCKTKTQLRGTAESGNNSLRSFDLLLK